MVPIVCIQVLHKEYNFNTVDFLKEGYKLDTSIIDILVPLKDYQIVPDPQDEKHGRKLVSKHPEIDM